MIGLDSFRRLLAPVPVPAQIRHEPVLSRSWPPLMPDTDMFEVPPALRVGAPAPEGRPEPSLTRPGHERRATIPAGQSVEGITLLRGFVRGGLVCSRTGDVLSAYDGSDEQLAPMAAAYARLVDAEYKALRGMGLETDLEDILITHPHELHLIHPLREARSVFLLLVLERSQSDLGIAQLMAEHMERRLLY